MAFTEKTFNKQTVAATEETLYTATGTDILKTIFLCNVTSSDATIELWIVDNGGSASDQNKILNGVTVPANDFTQITTYMPLNTTGDFIRAKCSVADAICCHLYGASVT